MANPVIFKDLPATFPEKDRFKKPSIAGSVILHALLIAALIVTPLMSPKTIQDWQLMTLLVSPPPPPPAAIPAPLSACRRPIAFPFMGVPSQRSVASVRRRGSSFLRPSNLRLVCS